MGLSAGVISCCCGAAKRAAEGDAAGMGSVVGGGGGGAGGARGAGWKAPPPARDISGCLASCVFLVSCAIQMNPTNTTASKPARPIFCVAVICRRGRLRDNRAPRHLLREACDYRSWQRLLHDTLHVRASCACFGVLADRIEGPVPDAQHGLPIPQAPSPRDRVDLHQVALDSIIGGRLLPVRV